MLKVYYILKGKQLKYVVIALQRHIQSTFNDFSGMLINGISHHVIV